MSYLDVLDLMPYNWDDQAQWDVYYEAYQKERLYTNPTIISLDLMGTRLIPVLTHNGWRKVWFPGCGMSVVPLVFAALGFDVWASDASTMAIRGQDEMRRSGVPSPALVDQAKSKVKPEELPNWGDSTGTIHLIQHDFRTDFVESEFDCILNVKAFQALSLDSMAQVARTHWRALALGKQAIFETINVQGERRDHIENCLVQAGFYVPNYAAQRWYRQVLNETGIPYIFILGQPLPDRQSEQYQDEDGQQKYEAARTTFRSFGEEYRRRLKQEAAENEYLFTDGHTKIAHVIYSTG